VDWLSSAPERFSAPEALAVRGLKSKDGIKESTFSSIKLLFQMVKFEVIRSVVQEFGVKPAPSRVPVDQGVNLKNSDWWADVWSAQRTQAGHRAMSEKCQNRNCSV
jgi:hypothetical protein